MSDEQKSAQDADRLNINVNDDPKRNFVQVELKGRIDIFTYQELSQHMAALYDKRAGISIVLDLSQVYFVASSGWATLLTMRSRLARMNGRMALAGLSEELVRIYESMKLQNLLPRYNDAAQAVAALGQG